MTINNYIFNSLEELEENLFLDGLDEEKTLVQIFSGFVKLDDIKSLQEILNKKNPKIKYIGTTTAGEISNGKSLNNKIIVSVSKFENTTFRFYSSQIKDSQTMGKELYENLITKNSKIFVCFFDGLNSSTPEVIDTINEINPDIKIAGANAADNNIFKKTFVFTNDELLDNGCVAVSLNSDVLNVYTGYEFNWKPIGQEATITKAEGNRVYEINNMSVVDFYSKYLGKDIGNNLPHSASEFSLLFQKDGFDICRSFIRKYDDGSVLIHGELNKGDKVRLSYGNVHLILNNSKLGIRNYINKNIEALYIYSCSARKTFLQDAIEIELAPFNNVCESAGFFSYGEFFHNGHKNNLLNVSMTVLGLSEKEPNSDDELICEVYEGNKNFLKNKHYLVLDALTNLSNTVIQELEETQKELNELAVKDYLTQLYNRRYFDTLSKDLINICRREKSSLCLIIMDIDEFKKINDSYGHKIGDEVLKKLANILTQNTRKSDIVSRFGGDEFVILLPFTIKENAVNIAEKIRQKVIDSKLTIGDQSYPFTISLGLADINLDADNPINDAYHRSDVALYEAKKYGRNKVVSG